jgi:hypothetical protein
MYDWYRSPQRSEYSLHDFRPKEKKRAKVRRKMEECFQNFKKMTHSDAFRLKYFKETYNLNLIASEPKESNWDPVLKQHILPHLSEELQEMFNSTLPNLHQEIESVAIVEDLTHYQKPIRYEYKPKKIVTKYKHCTTTTWEKYRARRTTNMGNRRQNKRVIYVDEFYIGDLVYERDKRGLLALKKITGIALQEKIIQKNLVILECHFGQMKQNEIMYRHHLKEDLSLKRKSIFWKEIYKKWKKENKCETKEKKLQRSQLEDIESLYNKVLSKKYEKLNNYEAKGRNQAIANIQEALTEIKKLKEQRKSLPPTMMRCFQVLRKGKPNIIKRISIDRNNFVPRRSMIRFMVGYDVSSIILAINSIVFSREVHKMKLIHSNVSLVPKVSTDLTKVRILASVKLKKLKKKVKWKAKKRNKYPVYEVKSIQSKKKMNNVKPNLTEEAFSPLVWNCSKNIDF